MKITKKQGAASRPLPSKIIFALCGFAIGMLYGRQSLQNNSSVRGSSASDDDDDDGTTENAPSAVASIVQPTNSSSSSSSPLPAPVIQQLGVSASGKWRLWHEMTPEQRNQSMVDVSQYVRKYGALVKKDNNAMHITDKSSCRPKVYGKTSGDHMLCSHPRPPQPCFFLSSGIHKDPSFDLALADDWKCRGIAFDPTVDHTSHLHPLVTFHNIGLNTVGANEEKKQNQGGEDWWYTSAPNAAKFFDIEYIDVLKLDCEGCEYAFTRDIIAQDPTFLSRVGQLAIEIHVSKAWIDTEEQLYYFAILFPLLEEAGFRLISSKVNVCGMYHEKYNCRQELHDWGYLCGYTAGQKVTGSCHNFLFVRDDRRSA